MWRWIARIAIGLVATVALAIAAVVIFASTDRGRELARGQIEHQLDGLFTGGASVGRVDGTPFGELVVHDVVIRAPDRSPAISIGTLRVRANLLDLVHHEVSLGELVIDQADVDVDKLAHLMAPRPDTGPSKWNIDLASMAIRRSHVHATVTRLGAVDLDDFELAGNAHLHANGTRGAGIALHARWREHAAPIAIEATVRDDVDRLAAPLVDVELGRISVAVHDAQLVKRDRRVSGGMKLAVPRAELARLAGVDLPGDVALALAATADGRVALDGALGGTPVTAKLDVDLAARHVAGAIHTGDFALASLTRGKIHGTAGAAADLDVAPDAVHVTAHAHGTYEKLPPGDVVLAVDSHGDRTTATVDVTGPAILHVAGVVTRAGASYRLDHASVVAHARDVTPIRGAVDAVLAARGPLWPHPVLTVAGSVRGAKLRVAGASLADVEVAIDARGLPARPRGTAHVHAFGLARGNIALRSLVLDATSRPDGWIDVSSAAKAPQLDAELAARVKPGPSTEIDVVRHRVIAGGQTWTGTTGRVVIDHRGVSIDQLATSSAHGRATLDGRYARTGDLRATLDASGIDLGALRRGYAGSVGAHLEVARTRGLISAHGSIDSRDLALDPRLPALTAHVTLDAEPGKVAVAGALASQGAGKADLAIELAAPRDLTSVPAWRALGGNALSTLRIRADHVDLGKLAPDRMAGIVDGELSLAPADTHGAIRVRDLRARVLDGLGTLDAQLAVSQPAPDELVPELAITAKQLGKATARLDLRVPSHPFDATAWRRLGTHALHSASIQTSSLAFDPSVMKRFGVTTMLRGHAALDVSVGEGLSSIQASAKIPDLRGSPLAKPVDVTLDASLDDHEAVATFAMISDRHAAMVDARVTVPVTLAQLRAGAWKALPIAGAITVHETSAAQLLAAFGRTEVTSGTLAGTITVAGAVGAPTADVHLTAANLQASRGPAGTRDKQLDKLALDGTWDGHRGTLKLRANESANGALSIDAQGAPDALGAATATITARGFELAPLLAFVPGPAGGVTGRLDGKLDVHGFDPRTSQVGGKLHVAGARVPVAPEVGTLRDGAIDVTVAQHGLTIAAKGKLGRGTVDVHGTVTLDQFAPSGGQATIALTHVSPIGSVQPLIDAHMAVKLARKGDQWIADVTVDHGFVKLEKGGEKLKPVGAPRDLAFGAKPPPEAKRPGGPPPKQAMFVVNLTLKPTPVESDQVRTNVKGTLHVTADLHGVDLQGQVDAVGGDVQLFDRRYRIEQAEARFDGTPDPMVAVEISYDFPDMTLTAQVHGRASKPQLQLSSNPGNYTQAQLLGFLLGGEPGGDTQGAGFADTATSAGESFIGGALGGYVKNAIPGIKIDVLKYSAATATSSEAIQAGSWITHALFFQFTEHPEARPDENAEEGTLEYWLTHRLELQLTAGDRNYDGIDLLWRKRY